jgi:Uma2 family endonuclease
MKQKSAIETLLATPRHWRYSDLEKLPEDGTLYEILKGELIVKGTPSRAHQWTSKQLMIRLALHAEARHLGEIYPAPFGVILDPESEDPETGVVPDIVYISRERLGILTDMEVRGAPDLLVEILSPSTADIDRNRKWKTYAERGVAHYWIVDPLSHTLEAYHLQEDIYELAEFLNANDVFEPALFPGLSIPLAEIWYPR